MKFSIIIPIDRTCVNFEKCLNSIYTQTYRDYEILVINKSDDRDIKLLIDRNKDKIKEIDTNDIDINEAKNMAISKSKGEYIFIMNSNDYLEINTLSILEKATRSKSQIIRFQMRTADKDMHEKVVSEISFKICSGRDALNKILKYKYVYDEYLYIFNSDYIKNNNYKFENKINSSFGLIPLIIYKADSVLSIGDILYNHYINCDDKKNITSKQEVIDLIYLGKKLINNIDNNELIYAFVAKEIIVKATLLKGEDYKSVTSLIKSDKIIDMTNLSSIKKMLYNIDIKLASRLIGW